MWKKLSQVEKKMDELRELGVQKGNVVGWDWDLLPFTVMLGKTTYIGAAPASGKTEFWFELLINLSCNALHKFLLLIILIITI